MVCDATLHNIPAFHHPPLSVFSLFVRPRPLTLTLAILLPTLAETRTNKSVTLHAKHPLCLADQLRLGERVTGCAPPCFRGTSLPADIFGEPADASSFPQWAMGSVINVSPHPAIDRDATDIQLHGNVPLRDSV